MFHGWEISTGWADENGGAPGSLKPPLKKTILPLAFTF